MVQRKRRHSFSLLEVLISLILLFGAFIPILNDIATRAKLYRDMQEKTRCLITCEEHFFSELAWIATSQECSFELLQKGYKREECAGIGKTIITQFSPIVAPVDSSLKAYLGKLSIATHIERNSEQPPILFGEHSIDLFFTEKSI